MLISYSIRAENALNLLIYLHGHPLGLGKKACARNNFTNNLQVAIDSAEATGDVSEYPNGTISVSLKCKRGMKDK